MSQSQASSADADISYAELQSLATNLHLSLHNLGEERAAINRQLAITAQQRDARDRALIREHKGTMVPDVVVNSLKEQHNKLRKDLDILAGHEALVRIEIEAVRRELSERGRELNQKVNQRLQKEYAGKWAAARAKAVEALCEAIWAYECGLNSANPEMTNPADFVTHPNGLGQELAIAFHRGCERKRAEAKAAVVKTDERLG